MKATPDTMGDELYTLDTGLDKQSQEEFVRDAMSLRQKGLHPQRIIDKLDKTYQTGTKYIRADDLDSIFNNNGW